jgi:hypothetical protein
MIHDSIFAQASCDIIRQTACGWPVCVTCGKHVMRDGGCPVSLVSKVMED